MTSVVSMPFSPRSDDRPQDRPRHGCTDIRKAPEPLRKELEVRLDRIALTRGRLALRRAEMEQPEDALASRHARRLAPPLGPEDAGCAPVRREPAFGRCEQD